MALSPNIQRAYDVLEAIPSGRLNASGVADAINEALDALRLERERALGLSDEWEPKEFSILGDAGVKRRVKGLVRDGLGVHLNHTFHHIAVTHLHSGKRLAAFSSIYGATKFVVAILPLRDWALPLAAHEDSSTGALARKLATLAKDLP